jgi:hypothetical protein
MPRRHASRSATLTDATLADATLADVTLADDVRKWLL